MMKIPTISYFYMPQAGEERARLTDEQRSAEIRMFLKMAKYPHCFKPTNVEGIWCFSQWGFSDENETAA